MIVKQHVTLPLERQDYILHHLSNAFRYALIKTTPIRYRHIAKITIVIHLLIVYFKHLLILPNIIVQLHALHNTLYMFLCVLVCVHQMHNMWKMTELVRPPANLHFI